MKSKLQNLLILLIYIGITVGIYYVIILFKQQEFSELHLLYAMLIGCLAYLPRFILKRRQRRK